MGVTRRLFGSSLALLAMAASGLANAEVPVSCSVVVEYVLTAQDGTVIDTETYQSDFVVQPGVGFEDDFSTPTRFKLFTASMQQGRGRAVVTITYFNDVSTFNTIDFNTQLTLARNQAAESLSGANTFSTSLEPQSGHYTVSYELSCTR